MAPGPLWLNTGHVLDSHPITKCWIVGVILYIQERRNVHSSLADERKQNSTNFGSGSGPQSNSSNRLGSANEPDRSPARAPSANPWWAQWAREDIKALRDSSSPNKERLTVQWLSQSIAEIRSELAELQESSSNVSKDAQLKNQLMEDISTLRAEFSTLKLELESLKSRQEKMEVLVHELREEAVQSAEDIRRSLTRQREKKTVTYGTASAPYLATKCLRRLAELDGGMFPEAAKVLAEDFYVDDMMSGVDSIDEGVQLCADIQILLNGGGFTLRKWSSNCAAILEKIPDDCKDDRTSFELDDSSATIKTPGLVWEPSVTSHLLLAKSRVAPLDDLKKRKRKQSIPRLELSSALLLAHLYEKVVTSLKITVRSYFWTDSMIVRYWLSSSPSRWQQFVANRVSEIQHATRGGVWSHVPGTENPADILSRGVTADQLNEDPLWWNKALWMRGNEDSWPENVYLTVAGVDPTVLEENSDVSVVVNKSPPNEIFSLRSSLTRLVRITAWLLRWKHNAQQRTHTNRRSGILTYAERESALLHLVRFAQRECFEQELKDLQREGQVKSTSRINTLHPIMLDGIVRVGGRLVNTLVSTERKRPIVLDKNHPFTSLVMLHYHYKLLHAGQQLLIGSVRDRFWPLSIRSLARQTIHRCVTCFRNKPTVHEQLMADLPSERVTPAPPFLPVGVDYCGPFFIKYPNRQRIPVKYYAAIFVCLVTKAVHIEMIADLTTSGFLAALKRFVGRRGKPAIIMCDNGSNFVGAKRELDELRQTFLSQQSQQSIISEAADSGMQFRFIPAKTPNFGGLWEVAVKSMKQHLRRTIGLKILTPDELQTVFVQIESCLNSRPLTPLSNDPSDFEALTPGHFLIQRPLTAVSEPALTEVPEIRLSRWQQAQDFLQRIWAKWSTQYLSNLHNRTKWTRQRNNLFVGTMVLVKEDNLPPLKWALGRITHITSGSDGNIRVVTVKTRDGSFNRGISKICILPIRDNDDQSAEEEI
ncbi:uncharacterized protein LOC131687953 [Topomyia yanbarensis]|uniref:uncharacterized protein LOC131687953 n=1 Tax=Topomyia yanbarensis TaxID=2498891 RepID=UPI00273B9756|nr:uncharacterized protein LOC131687953 [Topomyia yanbarensis]